MTFRVLVVDDDELVRTVMTVALEGAGHHVIEACDGGEACRLLDDPDQVALIVTDLHMPEMDGIQLAKWARAHHPTVPILFVSGRPDMLDHPIARRYPYLSKPFTMHTFETTVTAMLHKTR